jgi:hypothetical protein
MSRIFLPASWAEEPLLRQLLEERQGPRMRLSQNSAVPNSGLEMYNW